MAPLLWSIQDFRSEGYSAAAVCARGNVDFTFSGLLHISHLYKRALKFQIYLLYLLIFFTIFDLIFWKMAYFKRYIRFNHSKKLEVAFKICHFELYHNLNIFIEGAIRIFYCEIALSKLDQHSPILNRKTLMWFFTIKSAHRFSSNYQWIIMIQKWSYRNFLLVAGEKLDAWLRAQVPYPQMLVLTAGALKNYFNSKLIFFTKKY